MPIGFELYDSDGALTYSSTNQKAHIYSGITRT